MPLALFHIGSALFQFVSAWISIAFVLKKRIGRVWILVFIAFLLKGALSIYTVVTGAGGSPGIVSGVYVPVVEFFLSGLFAAGFVLTGKWFDSKERLDARCALLSEADRSLAGALEEDRILGQVCDILAGAGGYRLAWIGVPEPDGTIHAVRATGAPGGFFAEAAFRWDDTPWGRLPPGLSTRTGETSVMRDGAQAEGSAAPWKVLRRFGFRSCISAPIDPSTAQCIVLTAHSEDARAFDPAEAAAFSAMSRRVGDALQVARRHESFANAKSSYDDLLRSQRDGVLLVREGKVVRANPAAASMLGYPYPELLFDMDPTSILVDGDASPNLRYAMRGPGPEGVQGQWEAPVRRRDGTTFYGEIAVTWISRENRRETFVPPRSGPLGMLILRDVTNRVRIMNELRRERDFSTRILEVSGALVLQLGLDGEILLFNRQCEETTGYAAEDVLGRRMSGFLIAEPFREAHDAAFGAILAGRAPAPLESRVLTAREEERTVSWKYAPLRDALGGITSVIVTGIDVTDRRRLEATIIEMQKMEAVGTLAGGIAHDFNNILTGILGSLDIAQRAVPPDCTGAAGPISDAIRASERAVALIRQLLDFSRRSPSEQRPVNLGNVVREVVTLFSQTIDRRIEITSSIEDGLPLALVDPNQVHQVLMNLCVNARDAILESLDAKDAKGSRPLTGYWIYVRAEKVLVDDEYCRIFPYARKGRFIRLSIGDNGAGMDEALQRRIFEPFFTTKKMGRGTGLGLSTVYGIVKQHNGWINLDSHPGKGTTFCAYFPEAEGAVEEEAPKAEADRPVEGKETVLFADDEGLIRDLGKMVLESFGYTVILAADGKEAIERFSENRDRIHLVILDMTMPQRSGLEAMREIRAIEPNSKVIISSGHTPAEGTGDAVFLPKPYRADALARTVRAVLDASGPALRTAPGSASGPASGSASGPASGSASGPASGSAAGPAPGSAPA
jgi:PAS domain S-box-containing protein